jgi:hypothetical protein
MKKFLHDIAERIKSMRQGRTRTQYRIVWEKEVARIDWLAMENSRGSVQFSWDEVLAVDAFKRDYFAVDCICLAFQTPDGWIETNEEMNGWSDFLSFTESRLPGFPPREVWWRNVAFPAFAPNHSRLWTKTPGPADRANR